MRHSRHGCFEILEVSVYREYIAVWHGENSMSRPENAPQASAGAQRI